MTVVCKKKVNRTTQRKKGDPVACDQTSIHELKVFMNARAPIDSSLHYPLAHWHDTGQRIGKFQD